RLDLAVGGRDLQRLALPQQHLLAVRGDEVRIDAANQRFRRALLHHEALQLARRVQRIDSRCCRRPEVIQLAALSDLQVAERCAAGGQWDDAVGDTVEV